LDPTRRHLLRALAFGAAVLLAPVRGRATPHPRDWVRELVPVRRRSAAVAAACRAAMSDAERRAARLRAELAPLPGLAARRTHLARRRAADLERGEIAVVAGWVLAATEAELCLLLHGGAA
jgi:hypothetical protein